MRDHLGHALELLAGKAVFLEPVEGEALQLAGTSGDFLAGQIRFELLEHVLGNRTLLEFACQMPRLAQAREGHAVGYIRVGYRHLVGRQVQVHSENHIALAACICRPLEILGVLPAAIAAPVGHLGIVHDPTSFVLNCLHLSGLLCHVSHCIEAPC